MNAPLSRYLTRFSAGASSDTAAMTTAVVPMVTLTAAELEARLDEARETERTEAEAAQAAIVGAMEAAQASTLAEALAAARAEWCAGAAGDLKSLIEGAFVLLQTDLAEEIAKTLRPLLADAVRERTCAALEDALARLLVDPAHPTIELRAPADLVAALRARGVSGGVRLVIAETPEAVVICGGTRIETRLAAALADLSATEV